MSRLAYCPFERHPAARQRVKDVAAATGFEITDSNLFAVRKAQGFLALAKDLAVLAFRGTEVTSTTDVLTDIDALKKSWDAGGEVHKGFGDATLEIWPFVAPALEAAKGRLLFTGHSLGAALATLTASLYRKLRGNPNVDLYTIGSPRCGDAAFVKTLGGLKAERHVDCCDLVCHLPPPELGFEHYGEFHYIKSGGELMTNPGEDIVKRDQESARDDYLIHESWRIGTVAVRDLADHAPINYVSALMGLR
jgi:predicted lipase